MRRILVIGALGQVGTALVEKLGSTADVELVVSADIRPASQQHAAHYIQLDARSSTDIRKTIVVHGINEVYVMAAMLSATGEQAPMKAWELNMDSLLHVLEIAREGLIDKVFWPSSIAVFGANIQRQFTPQNEVLQPSTVYGISKVSGELWCQYYHQKHGVDVRSVRYPGLIGSESLPGGGTTDYAVHIFHEALQHGRYECFLAEDRKLPMMHMSDAIRATLEIMDAPSENLKVRTSYNISGLSFDPRELAQAIALQLPGFEMSYRPDHRDLIAASWPDSIDDSEARKDWHWKPAYDLQALVTSMLSDLKVNSPL